MKDLLATNKELIKELKARSQAQDQLLEEQDYKLVDINTTIAGAMGKLFPRFRLRILLLLIN